MVSVNLLALAISLALGVQASHQIPHDLGNGLHMFSKDAKGSQVHKKVADFKPATKDFLAKFATHVPVKKVAGHTKRDDNGKSQCDNSNIAVDRIDLSQAIYQLDTSCDNGLQITKENAAVAIHDDVIVYFCNYDSVHTKSCHSSDVDYDVNNAYVDCNATPGWRNHPGDWQSYGFKSKSFPNKYGSPFVEVC